MKIIEIKNIVLLAFLFSIAGVFLVSQSTLAQNNAINFRYEETSNSIPSVVRESCPASSQGVSSDCQLLERFIYEHENDSGSRRFISQSDSSRTIFVNDQNPSSGTLLGASGSENANPTISNSNNTYQNFSFNPSSTGGSSVPGSQGSGGGGGSTTTTPGTQGSELNEAPAPENVFNNSNEQYENTNCKTDGTPLNEENCGILKWVYIAINTMTVVFGIIAVIMIAYGGVEYTISRDNPQIAAKAKERIRNVLIAVVAYVFLYAFLQYIIPGGVL